MSSITDNELSWFFCGSASLVPRCSWRCAVQYYCKQWTAVKASNKSCACPKNYTHTHTHTSSLVIKENALETVSVVYSFFRFIKCLLIICQSSLWTECRDTRSPNRWVEAYWRVGLVAPLNRRAAAHTTLIACPMELQDDQPTPTQKVASVSRIWSNIYSS